MIQEGFEHPLWSVETWLLSGLGGRGDMEHQAGEWKTFAYPTLDKAMEAFLKSPRSSRAQLKLGDEVGMYISDEDATACMLSAEVANSMLDAHEQVCRRLLAEGFYATDEGRRACGESPPR